MYTHQRLTPHLLQSVRQHRLTQSLDAERSLRMRHHASTFRSLGAPSNPICSNIACYRPLSTLSMRSAAAFAEPMALNNMYPAVGRPVIANSPRMGVYKGLSGSSTPKIAFLFVNSKADPTCTPTIASRFRRQPLDLPASTMQATKYSWCKCRDPSNADRPLCGTRLSACRPHRCNGNTCR